MIKNLEKLIETEITNLGFIFVGLEFLNQHNNKLLRIYVDLNTQSGVISTDQPGKDAESKKGVTLDDCVTINRHLNRYISTLKDLNLPKYTLEISSPGLERKLFGLSQFNSQIGKEIKIKLKVQFDDKRIFNGILQKVDLENNKILIETQKKQLCFDYSDILSANLVCRDLI